MIISSDAVPDTALLLLMLLAAEATGLAIEISTFIAAFCALLLQIFEAAVAVLQTGRSSGGVSYWLLDKEHCVFQHQLLSQRASPFDARDERRE
jgi:hypothetical protein